MAPTKAPRAWNRKRNQLEWLGAEKMEREGYARKFYGHWHIRGGDEAWKDARRGGNRIVDHGMQICRRELGSRLLLLEQEVCALTCSVPSLLPKPEDKELTLSAHPSTPTSLPRPSAPQSYLAPQPRLTQPMELPPSPSRASQSRHLYAPSTLRATSH